MFLVAIVSPVLGANCYVVAPEGAGECVLVDPGFNVKEQVDVTVAEHGLRPVAALVTHGHVDHTFSLAELCRRDDLPVYIHEADRYRLKDPIGTLGPEFAPMFAGLAADWSPPPDVRPVSNRQVIEIAGLTIRVIHAPGHTEGSVLYHVAGPVGSAGVCFTGDVLFTGTVGRIDLPGGDGEMMNDTLRRIADPEADGLPDDITILPGHGEGDSLGRQRVTNPYLNNF
ncbi:MBL fold metallo-hydrolase [Phytoactinopolyspora alkaliphila]|uniref:MBL fold metallo-hydrolase n=1 Tax=Phytoactinopolyspora alkaliphila TaxID=1783498 RepID=A0A6N9YRC0_9ACTN|nr:MBL fold metallo-hydrolase [Phytoactinopolyspora alkaliphila]